jgi:hypothetical protein
VPAWENQDQNARSSRQDSKLSSSYEGSVDSKGSANSRTHMANSGAAKYNSQLSRMLHQIQSDIKVKEELVSHLEKSETEFTFMRKKFDEKINDLQSQLAETQKEKDMALMRTKSGLAIKNDVANHQTQQAISRGATIPTAALLDKQNADIRHAYELKMKSLMSEIQDLKRKYANATTTMQSTRNQNESTLRSLKMNVETLKIEKKRLIQRMKAEADKVREQMSRQERKIQQLQRQHAKSNQDKKRLEREHEQQKFALKKRNEEIMVSANQLKQLTLIMKKAVREGGILDEKMLAKMTPIMGGSFAVIARGGGHGFPRRQAKKKNPIPLGIRVSRKKELLDKALYQYIQGKQAVVEMEQLLVRRERLVEEKMELEDERDQVYDVEKDHEEATGQPMDTIAIELMDERIDLLSAEVSYLTARIRTLQSEAAEEALQAEESGAHVVKNVSPRPPKHVTFVDEIVTEPIQSDEWADMDSFDDQFSVPANAAPEMAYDITSKLIKSFESDECKRIIENLVDDIMDLRMSECNRQITVQNLEKTVMDLRRTIIAMKRAAISDTSDSERRIRQLSGDSMMDLMMREDDDNHSIDDYINGNTLFGKTYEDDIRSMVSNKPTPSGNNATSSQFDQNQQISLPNSPVASPPYVENSYANSSKPPLPTKTIESIIKSAAEPRDSTPSPDRFYNMIQKRLSWQREGTETPNEEDELLRATMAAAEAMANAAAARSSSVDFGHYISDHDSSTSSIRSSHLRRSSIQSDMSSVSSWNQNRGDNSTDANNSFSRSITGAVQRISPLLSHINQQTLNTEMNELQDTSNKQQPFITSSCQQQNFIKRPLPPLMPSSSTFERSTTPSVFDRLAQTPTRASKAKMNYRHSSGSVEDLRRRWELEQRPSSVMSSNY